MNVDTVVEFITKRRRARIGVELKGKTRTSEGGPILSKAQKHGRRIENDLRTEVAGMVD